MQDLSVHRNLDSGVIGEDMSLNPQRHSNSRGCCTWKRIAQIGVALGSGVMLSTLLTFAIPSFPVITILVTGAVVLAVSIIALWILSNKVANSSISQIEFNTEQTNADVEESPDQPLTSVPKQNVIISTVANPNDAEKIAASTTIKESSTPQPSVAPSLLQNSAVSVSATSTAVLTATVNNVPSPAVKESVATQPTCPPPPKKVQVIDTFEGKLKSTQLPELSTGAIDRFQKWFSPPPLTITQLINYYDSCWDAIWHRFDAKKIEKVYSEKRIVNLMETYVKQFHKEIDYKKNFGFIEKRDIPKNSRVFIRADLHGDLKSLIENLKVLVNQGVLDENFKCKPDVQIILLGDYSDRGEHCVKILELMMLLKIQNPNQVHFIRGNHEYLDINEAYGSKEMKGFIGIMGGNSRLLNHFYQTMPLTIYMAATNGNPHEKKIYKQFTHGTYELTTDPSVILDSPESYKEMIVSKKRVFSERMLKLAGDSCPASIQSISEKGRFYQEKIDARRRELKDLRSMEQANDLLVKSLELQISALRVRQLAETLESDEISTAYNWGDVKKYTEETTRGTKNWNFSPEDVEHYLRLSSTLHLVDTIFRGHEHTYAIWERNGKVIVHTLTIGMDTDREYLHDVPIQPDIAYIMTTGDGTNWSKQALLREAGASKTSITAPIPLESTLPLFSL